MQGLFVLSGDFLFSPFGAALSLRRERLDHRPGSAECRKPLIGYAARFEEARNKLMRHQALGFVPFIIVLFDLENLANIPLAIESSAPGGPHPGNKFLFIISQLSAVSHGDILSYDLSVVTGQIGLAI